jgi:toxin-antitoxin system PIN domain toxin
VSYSLDVNILLYASDRSSSRHQAALKFLEARAADPDLLCVTWPTLLSYLRIATHPRIFAEPLSPTEALLNIESLTGLSRARVICEEENFLSVYREVTRGFTVRGNLVPDAHLAALLRQHEIRTLYTTDADFRKFEFLDVRNPFV